MANSEDVLEKAARLTYLAAVTREDGQEMAAAIRAIAAEVRGLRKDRDYWAAVAHKLTQQVDARALKVAIDYAKAAERGEGEA